MQQISFGEYLRDLRVGNGMTLSMLAEGLNLSPSTLSKIENGKRHFSESSLFMLSEIFNVELAVLEKEYYSDKIANLIYPKTNSKEMLALAEEKATYLRNTRQKQGKLNL